MQNEQQIRLLYVTTLDRFVSVMYPHVDAARARGWRVESACRPTGDWEDLRKHVDATHDVPLARFPLHIGNLVGLFRLVALMRSGKYDIIHCHNPTGGFVGRLAATIANWGAKDRAMRIYTAHGFHFHRRGGVLSNALYRTAERIAGHFWSDAVMVITPEDYAAARDGGVVPREKLYLTHGVGVSALEEFDPALIADDEGAKVRAELGIAPAAPMVTMVAEMIPRKRHRDSIAAFAQVHARFPDAVLLLVGDGPLHKKLQRQAQEAGIGDKVIQTNFRRDIRRILAATDIFLLSSGQEGLPCAIQEALCMNVPVVASDVRGNADLVDDSCGWLVPLGNVNSLAARLEQALRLSPEERRQMGMAGREKMLQHYERTACVAEWQDIYARALESQSVKLSRQVTDRIRDNG